MGFIFIGRSSITMLCSYRQFTYCLILTDCKYMPTVKKNNIFTIIF